MWRNRTTDTEDEPVVVERNDPVVVERTKDPTYVRERTAPERVGERREEVASFMPVGSMLGRVILTLIGAALLIVGAMLDWVNGIAGTSMSWEAWMNRTLQLPLMILIFACVRERWVTGCCGRHTRWGLGSSSAR